MNVQIDGLPLYVLWQATPFYAGSSTDPPEYSELEVTAVQVKGEDILSVINDETLTAIESQIKRRVTDPRTEDFIPQLKF